MKRGLAALAIMSTVAAGLLWASDAVMDGPGQETLIDAQELWKQHEFDEADAAFARVASRAAPLERAKALAWRGLLAWRYRHEHELAERLFDEAIAVGEEEAGAWHEKTRMLRAGGRFAEAWDATLRGEAAAGTDAERLIARSDRAEVAIAEAISHIERAPGTPLPSAVRAHLDAGHAALAKLMVANIGDLTVALPLMRTSVLRGDGPGLLAAWRSYFLLIIDKPDAGVLNEPRRMLSELLPDWSGVPDGHSLGSVIEALLASGAVDEAWLMLRSQAFTHGVEPAGPRLPELVAYTEFFRAGRELTDEFYRQTSLGNVDSSAVSVYRGAFVDLARPLWDAIDWPQSAPKLTQAALIRELESRFNVQMLGGSTADYEDLHYGHKVINATIGIEQYGHGGTLQFAALDGMMSNGYQSWAWDHRSQHGGWPLGEVITQVRSAYAAEAHRVWRLLSDPVAVNRVRDEMERESERDWQRAADDPHAFLPGLVMRMRWQGAQELLSDVGASLPAVEGAESSFLVSHDRAVFGSSIRAHEGRHVIDNRINPRFSSEEMEFRAKLSEVAFAEYPRLSFGNVLSGSEGARTPHGRANQRIKSGLVKWMQEHLGEIKDLDPTRPLLPQLDLLANAQLVLAVQSMDPLAENLRNSKLDNPR